MSATTQAIAEANHEIYDRMLVSIEGSIGLLQIFIAVCDADDQRELIISDYEKELGANVQSYRVYLERQEPSLRKAIADTVTVQEKAVVTVLGAETLGLLGQDELLKKFFGYLQWTREALREFKLPIILWVPSRIFEQLANRSPDFWSWRNGVFRFWSEFSLSPTSFLNLQSIHLIQPDRPSSIFSVEQMEVSLADTITRWGDDSRQAAMLYANLGNLYIQQSQDKPTSSRAAILELAQECFTRAIILQRKFKDEHALAKTLGDLAKLYDLQEKRAEAEALYIEALAIYRGLVALHSPSPKIAESSDISFGSEREVNDYDWVSFDLLDVYYSFGMHHHRDRAWTLAEPHYHNALSIYRDLGVPAKDYAANLNNLAGLYRSQGREAEAERFYLEAIETYRKSDGVQATQELSASLDNLANLYNSQGREEEAKQLYIEAGI
jgi:tetratricopeptide (TPR) repeat protein